MFLRTYFVCEAGTELVEIEGGVAENESIAIALTKAVETGVLNIIKIGIEKAIGNMKNLISIFVMLSLSVMADDNEIYIDQSGATANIDLEQLGDDGNIIGGVRVSAGNLTPVDLDGDSLTLDINQIIGSNTFLEIFGLTILQAI